MSVPTAFFDVNGTMIKDRVLQDESWKDAIFAICGVERHKDDFYKILWEFGPMYFLKEIDASGETIDMCCDMKRAFYKKRFENSRPDTVTGLSKYLDYLKSRNTDMHIVTNVNRTDLEMYFDTFGFDRWFDINTSFYTDRNTRIRPKPFPDLYLNAMSVLGVSSEDVTVFEDSKEGTKAALDAGIKRIVNISEESRIGDFGRKEIINSVNFEDECLYELF